MENGEATDENENKLQHKRKKTTVYYSHWHIIEISLLRGK